MSDRLTVRLLSADPVIDPSDPLQTNGYAYADNSLRHQEGPGRPAGPLGAGRLRA